LSTSSSERFLEAGRVGRAHGLDGSFHVTSPRPRLLTLGTPTDLGEIVRRSGTDEKPVIRVTGHDTREAAEALHGRPLLVALADAPELEPGEWWAHELEGLSVTDGPRAVGTVRRMLELPSVEVLEVERPDGSELLVPMVGDAIRTLDVENRRVDVDLGFLDAD
jgi:16S rRNA processing protein RimM